jgi:DNA-binding NtrC family response regulator
MNGSPIIANSERLPDAMLDTLEASRHGLQTTHQTDGDWVQKRSLNILCIDDVAQVRQLLYDCLTRYNHRVTVASGGKLGMELFHTAMLKNQPYEAVVTDLSMQDMDGHHVARLIKAESPGTPVIMMTGWGTIMWGGGVSCPEVDAVVSKPLHMEELNKLILRMTASAPKAKG